MDTNATDVTKPQETTEQITPVPDANADTGKDTTGEQDKSKMVQMPQSDLDRLMADRAGQAKRNALSDLAKALKVENVNELDAIVESHKQAEEVKVAAEEANKTELQKSAALLNTSEDVRGKQAQTINDLLIENAVITIAPSKEVAMAYLADLLTLMDKSTIEIKDGVVDTKTVEAAIEKTLEDRDYLKASSSNGNRHGSPLSRHQLPKAKQQTEQPVKQKYGGI